MEEQFSYFDIKDDAYKKERLSVRSVASRYYDMRDVLAGLRKTSRVIKDIDHKWSGGPQHWGKDLMAPSFDLTQSLHIHYVDLVPQGKSQKHGHQNEALAYVLEGRGYEIHDGKTYEWNTGDLVLIHGGSVHQHFNADPEKPARVLIFKPKPLCMFLHLIYQATVEHAPKEQVPGWENYQPLNIREMP